MSFHHVIYHYSPYIHSWKRPGMIQIGPAQLGTANSLRTSSLDCREIYSDIIDRLPQKVPPLIYYTDNFYLRQQPLRNIKGWPAPSLLVCGDLHHGYQPLSTLHSFLNTEKFDAVLLLCNQSMVNAVRQMTTAPVRFLPPSFFKYETAPRKPNIERVLVHIGSIGKYHPHRRKIVEHLSMTQGLPFKHHTTSSPSEAAEIFSRSALALNVPLNGDLNHRFYECMASGIPQLILGTPDILGNQESIALRRDLFWVNSVEEIDATARKLLDPNSDILDTLQVPPPPEWDIDLLMKRAFEPYKQHLE